MRGRYNRSVRQCLYPFTNRPLCDLKQSLKSLFNYMIEIHAQPTLRVISKRSRTTKIACSWVKIAVPDAITLLTGSTFLDVDMSSSDIDVLVTGPITITEEDFMSRFRDYLLYYHCIKARVVQHSSFKVLSFFLFDIKLDFIYARLMIDAKLMSHSMITNCLSSLIADEDTLPLIASYEFNFEISNVVTGPYGSKFGILVRCIKLWAQSNDIAGNINSIPSIAWIIMTVKCFLQLKELSIPYILQQFFQYYKEFPFRKRAVVWICKEKKFDEKRTDSRPMEVKLPYWPYSNITKDVSYDKLQDIIEAFGHSWDFIHSLRRGEKLDWTGLFVRRF
ncbi:hypothetical protein ACOME3_004958 [Neoechinorhynchus agilis]